MHVCPIMPKAVNLHNCIATPRPDLTPSSPASPSQRPSLETTITTFKDSEMAEPVIKWKALVVDDVDEKALMTGARKRGGTYPALPVAMVKLPSDEAAVLSWRWDGDHHVYGSKNVLCAIRCAKQIGVRYLFIDAISIDQQKCGDALIDEIVAFSTLYKSIQVIAAYDRVGDKFDDTMLRPWILSEALLFRHNPTRVVYVGYSDQGGGAVPSILSTYSNFESRLHMKWILADAVFTHTILGVLCGKIGMCSISDFKAILPTYARIFSAAYEQMSCNDYLLTAAILCSKGLHLLMNNTYVDAAMFDRYTLSQPRSLYSFVKEEMDIFLDGTKLATWTTYKDPIDDTTNKLNRLPDTTRLIFAALGLSEAEYEGFAKQMISERASFKANNRTPEPEIDVRSISLDPFS
jgi:hypothetical protein